jgi:hypothetical protein
MKYLFTLLLTLSFLPQFAAANTYTVTPPVIEHNVEARDMLEDSIRITNTGTVPVKLFPSVHPIALGEDGSIKSFESPVMTDQTRNVTSWIAISRARVELQPGESIRIPVSITIHPNAVAGDYYAFIGFGSGDKRDEAEAAVINGQAPGVIMRISTADTNNEYLRLHNFQIDRYITGTDESLVTYELENIGDTAVVPKGEIIIYDVRGREVGALPINADGSTLAPADRVTYTGTLPETGAYGRHKAFLNLEYGSAQRANLYDTTFFTVVPLNLLLAIFGGLLVMSFILTLLYIRRNRVRDHHYDDESVAMYVRSGVHSNIKDHDINLKQD